MRSEVAVERLRRFCDPASLGFRTTEELKPVEGIIGQARAIRALQFGLGIQEHGFNVYVAGLPGTGRTTAVKAFLEQVARQKEVPPDWCYVHNFKDPYHPRALKLPPGMGRVLEEDMRRLIEEARREIPKAFEKEDYTARKERIGDGLRKRREQLFTHLGESAQEKGFLIQSSQVGLLIIPVVEGNPMSDQEFMGLPAETREEILKRRSVVEEELKAVMKELKAAEKEANEELQNLDREVALFAVGHLFSDLKEKYEGLPQVLEYLKAVEMDILEKIGQFRSGPEGAPEMLLPMARMRELAFRRYQVNVMVDNSGIKGAPVVMEFNPTYNNLFGRMEKESEFGTLMTDFTMIRPGSLHRANGGFLVLQVEDVLRNLFSWDGLKRSIRNREIIMEEAGERLGFIATKSLSPEPIPLDSKVILIGSPLLYHLLYAYDQDFDELFKVKADFDTRMDWTDENIKTYAASLWSLCCKEHLKHMDAGAVAQVIEHSARLAEHQEKLSTRFIEIADILREANHYASLDGSPLVSETHVEKAIEERIYRSNLVQERINELIEKGVFLIDTEGEVVGQVNGLAVISLGDFVFGRPNRITVSIGMGREGLIDIEREAKLGGRIHSKGVMILSGFLAERYAQSKPLALSARVVFEQSYEEVEGDSASSTELYALLSALSGLPIRQGIAVTGSVNQKGQVQAIGGVNQKIEGFFKVCRAKGLTGDQGVIIPESNLPNLMLHEEVVEAVRDGKFHIWPVKTIDEGIEILTGQRAGDRRPEGTFEPNTVNERVDQRLQELARQLRDFMKEEGKEKGGAADSAQGGEAGA
ncbi:MAG: ATP-binding protein [candidate division NC10 bacterium]|nr:ATP-binding protein [candidate division NC10 bacterium]